MGERETRQVGDLVRENEDLREQWRAIGAVLHAVTRSEGLQPVLDEIVAAAKRLCRGEHAQLYLAEGDRFLVFSQVGDDPAGYAYAQEHPHMRDRTTVIGRTALAREAVQIPDVLADAEYSFPGQLLAGYRALLGVPILVDDDLIGAIAIGRNTPGPFLNEHVELVKTFADQAAIAIANARLIETVERQRTELSRFLPPQVAELVSSKEGEALLSGHRAYVTCFFCDLRGFTAFAETAAPEELFEVLRQYHGALGELIPMYGGTLEHFAGDGILVFFNDPLAIPDHELQAIRLAIAAHERFGELARGWRKRGTELGLGIGIEAGYATLGRIGFEGRYDYAALGPVVNVASRLSDRAVAGQILIGPHTYGAVEESVRISPVGDLDLKGFGRPIPTYEVRGLRTAR
ncbi:MAG: adenylate/guanylate cyclase domain-containing protein [Gaiellaceae bacterium]